MLKVFGPKMARMRRQDLGTRRGSKPQVQDRHYYPVLASGVAAQWLWANNCIVVASPTDWALAAI